MSSVSYCDINVSYCDIILQWCYSTLSFCSSAFLWCHSDFLCHHIIFCYTVHICHHISFLISQCSIMNIKVSYCIITVLYYDINFPICYHSFQLWQYSILLLHSMASFDIIMIFNDIMIITSYKSLWWVYYCVITMPYCYITVSYFDITMPLCYITMSTVMTQCTIF